VIPDPIRPSVESGHFGKLPARVAPTGET